MNDNQIGFDPNDLKKTLETTFNVDIAITTNGETKQEKKDKKTFINFLTNLDLFLVNQHILSDDLGIDLSLFLVPLHKANQFLMDKIYGELGCELILQYIENKDLIAPETPMFITDNNIRYKIIDDTDLYSVLKILQTPDNSKNGKQRRK